MVQVVLIPFMYHADAFLSISAFCGAVRTGCSDVYVSSQKVWSKPTYESATCIGRSCPQDSVPCSMQWKGRLLCKGTIPGRYNSYNLH
jgi:hypothetical protein